MRANKIKLVEEVSRRKIEHIVYASFFVGFMASAEKRSPSNPDNFKEIKNLIHLIVNDPIKHNNSVN